VEIGKILFETSPKQKVLKTPSQQIKKLGVVPHTCHTSYVRSINRKVMVLACLCINTRPYIKNNQSKHTGLDLWFKSSKRTALSSNPSNAKKKKDIFIEESFFFWQYQELNSGFCIC
jgi:hypothetical protein